MVCGSKTICIYFSDVGVVVLVAFEVEEVHFGQFGIDSFISGHVEFVEIGVVYCF